MKYTGMIRKAVSGLLNKKRFLALVLILALAFSCIGCGDYDEEENRTTQEARPQETEGSGAATTSASVVRGLSINVDNTTGELLVTRKVSEVAGETGDSGVWTIFVYLCGTDLESFYGMGTGDLEEMCAASGSEQVRFVVETGGTYEWKSSSVGSENRQRFLVQNGAIEQVDEQTRVNMGNPSTLTEFLVWGVENYASEYMGLVLWDHGGGSVTGVCFD